MLLWTFRSKIPCENAEEAGSSDLAAITNEVRQAMVPGVAQHPRLCSKHAPEGGACTYICMYSHTHTHGAYTPLKERHLFSQGSWPAGEARCLTETHQLSQPETVQFSEGNSAHWDLHTFAGLALFNWLHWSLHVTKLNTKERPDN